MLGRETQQIQKTIVGHSARIALNKGHLRRLQNKEGLGLVHMGVKEEARPHNMIELGARIARIGLRRETLHTT